MKRFFLFSLFTFAVFLLTEAKKPVRVVSATTEAIAVDSAWDDPQNRVHAFIRPYKEALQEQMGIVLGQAQQDMDNENPHGRLSLWMAQVQADRAQQALNRPIDLGLVNIGGIRCPIRKGAITQEMMYELMPFDNELVVVLLRGSDLRALVAQMEAQGGQGDCWQHGLTADDIRDDETYAIATSDYLSEGNDHMPALKQGKVLKTGLLLRSVYIDALKVQKKI